MLFAARKSYAGASVTFMLASFFRSNGFILSGFIVWDMMVGPLLFAQTKFSPRRIFINLLNCSFFFAPPFLPYFYHEYDAYRSFCSQSTIGPRAWCFDRLPSIYSYVQSAYWDVGLFRYWSLQQLPNISLAMPVLLLVFDASIAHIRCFFLPTLVGILSESTPRIATRKTDPLFNLCYSCTPNKHYLARSCTYADCTSFCECHALYVLGCSTTFPLESACGRKRG